MKEFHHLSHKHLQRQEPVLFFFFAPCFAWGTSDWSNHHSSLSSPTHSQSEAGTKAPPLRLLLPLRLPPLLNLQAAIHPLIHPSFSPSFLPGWKRVLLVIGRTKKQKVKKTTKKERRREAAPPVKRTDSNRCVETPRRLRALRLFTPPSMDTGRREETQLG